MFASNLGSINSSSQSNKTLCSSLKTKNESRDEISKQTSHAGSNEVVHTSPVLTNDP